MAADETPETVLRKIFLITMGMSVLFVSAAMFIAQVLTENTP